jgi:hypothetical protein
MAKQYIVSTEKGDPKFTMPEKLAIKVIAEHRGEWKTINGKSAYKMLVCAAIKIGRPMHMDDIKLIIWPNDWIFIEEINP